MNNPTPGSQDAQDQGCTCPVLDNNSGKGEDPRDKEPSFWISGSCPLHANEAEDD